MIPMQNREYQWFYCWQVLISSILFWVGMILYPDALGAQVYGATAQVFQAEAWAAGFMGASLLVIYGIHINGRWRWSPFLRILGFSLMAAMFSALVFSSLSAPTGVVIWAFTIPAFLYPCLRFLRLNILDARVRWQNGRRPN